MNIKRINKLFISILVIFTMILSITGCAEQKKEEQGSTSFSEKDNDKGSEKEDEKSNDKYKKIKIGMINIGSHTETNGYTFAHVSGVKKMAQNLNLSEDQIIYKDNIPDSMDVKADAKVEKAITECIDEGCNVIFTTSFGYKAATAKLAAKHPDIYFAHGSGDLSNGTNFIHYFGRIYQARYLSGIAAGLKTKTNKIGYVSAFGSDMAECAGGINAFAMGVASVNKKAKVYVRVTNTWFDETKERLAAEWLIKKGADVIAQHCDTAAPQVAAQKARVYGIGYNSDMSKEAPKATLLSVVWDWSAFYTWAIEAIANKTWTGDNYFGGLKEGLVSITDLASFNDPSAAKKIEEAQSKIVKGEWDVFEGVIPTNVKGKTIGKAGQSLPDDTIQFKINWFYENVVDVTNRK